MASLKEWCPGGIRTPLDVMYMETCDKSEEQVTSWRDSRMEEGASVSLNFRVSDTACQKGWNDVGMEPVSSE